MRWKPSGRVSAESPWDIQAVMVAGSESKRGLVFQERDFGVAVFALVGGANFAAEVMDDVLESVADAEGGQAEREDCGVGGRRVGVVDGAGASAEDEADGVVRVDLSDGRGAGQDDGEDVVFADPAGDELGVLRAEVEDDDGGEKRGSVHYLVWQGVGGAGKYHSLLIAF